MEDWLNSIPPLYAAICIGSVILFFIVFVLAATILPMLGIFGGIGWFLNKKSKEAKALRVAAQNWASTTGKVITSRVEVSGGENTTVSPHIVFQYNVYGKDFTSSQIKAGDVHWGSYGSRDSYDMVDKYPVDAEVTVYYDPENPQMSSLER
jgi:hypothetical protein